MRGRIAPLVFVLAACVAAASPAPRGWSRLVLSHGFASGRGYSVAVPPGVTQKPIEGIDSDVAALGGRGLTMLFDYGTYGGAPSCGSRPLCAERVETIGGRRGRTMAEQGAFEGHRGATRAFSAFVHEGGAIGLAVQAYCDDRAACARAAAIVRTIRFAR
jgi:hypothetical protein